MVEEDVKEERDLISLNMFPTTPGSSQLTLLIALSNSYRSDWSTIPNISDPLIENKVTETGVWVIRAVEILSFSKTSNPPQLPKTFSLFNPKSQYINCSFEEGESVDGKTCITSPHKVRGEMEGAKVGERVGLSE
jgi:hypothetical protein